MESDPPNNRAGDWSGGDITANHFAGHGSGADVPVAVACARAAKRQHVGPWGHRTEFFLSPKAPTSSGIIWGAGPVFLYPTATSDILGVHRWGVGPTAVALKQQGPWTVGVLANHIWSFAETSSLGSDVNSTFIQPFVGYTRSTAFTTVLNSESAYNWLSHRWIVPIDLLFSQVVKIGGQPVSFQAGPRYYIATTDQGSRWGLRFSMTLLFPTK